MSLSADLFFPSLNKIKPTNQTNNIDKNQEHETSQYLGWNGVG